jgi:hypothetical protein
MIREDRLGERVSYRVLKVCIVIMIEIMIEQR